MPEHLSDREEAYLSSHPATRTVRRKLPSALDSYQALLESLIAELTDLGWPSGELMGVQMALEESISNAIRHGNKEDPQKIVDVEFRLSADRFWARICDEGSGFEPDEVPDCCAPDRIDLPGGRGLALIRAYMTTVEYNERGNCLTFEKRLRDNKADPGAAQ